MANNLQSQWTSGNEEERISAASSNERLTLRKCIYVGQLWSTIKEGELYDIFSSFGRVTKVIIIRNSNGNCKGYAFVTFKSENVVKKLLEEHQYVELNRKTISIFPALKRKRLSRNVNSERRLGRNPSLRGDQMDVESSDRSGCPPAVPTDQAGPSSITQSYPQQTTSEGFPAASQCAESSGWVPIPTEVSGNMFNGQWKPPAPSCSIPTEVSGNVFNDQWKPPAPFCFTHMDVNDGNASGIISSPQSLYYDTSSSLTQAISPSTGTNNKYYQTCDPNTSRMIQYVGKEGMLPVQQDKRVDKKKEFYEKWYENKEKTPKENTPTFQIGGSETCLEEACREMQELRLLEKSYESQQN